MNPKLHNGHALKSHQFKVQETTCRYADRTPYNCLNNFVNNIITLKYLESTQRVMRLRRS